MTSIYLSGPIDGLTYFEATEWRNYIADVLEDFCDVLDPMRHVEASANTVLSANVAETISSVDPAMLTDHGIITRDHFDTCRSDVVIVNLLGAKQRSLGTIAELAWAWHLHIPTIIIIEPSGNVHEHPFLRVMTSFRVDTVDRAIDVARSILGLRSYR